MGCWGNKVDTDYSIDISNLVCLVPWHNIAIAIKQRQSYHWVRMTNTHSLGYPYRYLTRMDSTPFSNKFGFLWCSAVTIVPCVVVFSVWRLWLFIVAHFSYCTSVECIRWCILLHGACYGDAVSVCRVYLVVCLAVWCLLWWSWFIGNGMCVAGVLLCTLWCCGAFGEHWRFIMFLFSLLWFKYLTLC